MFGFMFGTLCLMGLFALKFGSHARYRRGYGPPDSHGRRGRRGGRGAGLWTRAGGEMLKRRLAAVRAAPEVQEP